jgi:signal transduction histidine kinase/DNA-binding NarL/FixJ family response regulator
VDPNVKPRFVTVPSARRRQSEAEAGAKQEALERMEQLRDEMLRAMEILHSVQALFEVKPEVTRAEFRRFVQSALNRLPELQALEWIPRVPAAARERYEEAARRDGLQGFHFTEIDSTGQLIPAEEREEYLPVFYAEPVRANAPALGLDLAADARRREALERSARTGLPSATSPLRLAQASGGHVGFLVVMPVRDPQGGVVGFGLAVFQISSLVDEIFAPLVRRGVRMEIRDQAEPSSVVYSAGCEETSTPAWCYEQDLPLVGRVWRFKFTPGETFTFADPDWLRRAAETLQRTNEVLEECVAERTAQLAELNQALQTEIEVRKCAEAAAAAANRAKSLFLAEMSHEIRTPLNVILGYTQLLQRDRELTATQAEAMRAIVEGGNHLLCLVDGVLDLTKIETGRMELEPVDFDLTVLIKGLVAMFAPRCQQKGLRLRLESLGETPVWQRGDERKLRQVLVNLLGNAVKFTDTGEVRLRVVPVGAASTFRFEVIDTGPGIPLEGQKAIFEPFHQENEGRAKGGTGLGLSIARRLIELMGGSLEVNSAPKWGSNFFFALSFAPSRTAFSPTTAEPFARLHLAEGCRVRALIVDDLKLNRDILGQMLRVLGCEVAFAESGAGALVRARAVPPDIVFVDRKMPGMDGIVAARELRGALADAPPKFVLYSALAFEHERERTDAGGVFDEFLPKPFRFERISETLTRLLQVTFATTTPSSAKTVAPRPLDLTTLELPEELIGRLRSSAEIGDFAQLRRLLREIEAGGPIAMEFARRLRLLAERFDTDAVLNILIELPTRTT